MRIIRFADSQGQIQLGRDRGDGQVEILEAGALPWSMGRLPRPTGQMVAMPEQLLAPIDPTNILCIGLNYAKHAREGGHALPARPVIFMKPTSALNHPGRPIRIPKCELDGPETDYEAELAVIIARPAYDVDEADALDYVLGYTCANDVSARRWQKHGSGGQWVRGKGFDTFCPLGPAIVTADEVPDPQTLRISTLLNGQVMQDANTADMIFPVRKLIALMSRDTTLLAGTVILTGTPSGVGFSRTPPVCLQHGDQVEIEIERIGRLSNPVE